MGGGHLGAWGVSPSTHMHSHTCTCTHAHLYMYRNCKWPPTWRHPCLACSACLTCMCMHACMHACACMCMHACVHGTPCYTPIPTPISIHPSTTPTPIHHPQGGWTPRITLNLITLQLIKIFQFRLKI